MKKSLIGIAAMTFFGVALANPGGGNSGNQVSGLSGGIGVSSAGASVMTTSNAASQGNGSALSYNAAKAGAQGSNSATASFDGNKKGVSGEAAVSGSADTFGTSKSIAITNGQGAAFGLAGTQAEAASGGLAGFAGNNSRGNTVAGGAAGGALSGTATMVGTSSIGNGGAIAKNSSSNFAGYDAAVGASSSGKNGAVTGGNSLATSDSDKSAHNVKWGNGSLANISYTGGLSNATITGMAH